MHVCYMTCHLYSYVQNMWFYPCHIATLLRITCGALGEPLLQDLVAVLIAIYIVSVAYTYA